MLEPDTNLPPILPAADEFAEAHQRRVYLFLGLASLLAVASTICYLAFDLDSLILPMVLLVAVAVVIAIWNYPGVTFYLLFTATLLFETVISIYPDAFVEKVPFFLNFNTIVQTYAHVDFKALPINLVEILLALTAVASGLRAAFNHQKKIVIGPLCWPIAAYILFVTLGWINGMATGGDFKISLQEVRPQFYFFIAYLMAVNVVRTPAHLNRVYWVTVLCIALKGIIYTVRRFTIFANVPVPEQGVGSHEEAFFFDCFEMLLMVLSFCKIHKHLRTLMWFLLPFVVLGNLATNRRAGTAAIMIVLPILMLVVHRALPERRKLITVVGIAMAILFPIYYFSFKNSDSMLGQPARAISSQFSPTDRDASSNAYRDAENADLYATIKLAPVQGYGYGKRMLHVAPIADISGAYDWWDIMTHNQVLWVWMRVGTFGMLSFWMMVCAIIIRACWNIRSETASVETKAASIFGMLVVCMLMFFGLLDLQFSNYRDMLFGGFWAGIVAAAPMLTTSLSSQEKGTSR
ncbi:MAG: hypothetical protein JWL77_6544 [Chthonomonadaceae bacterium]|nr:hypothetical protein [Chthonomonadaceae bacterium]